MFLPGEGVFSAALSVDPALIEFGVEARVIPASPTTLIALLRAVAYGWRQEQLADNARAISDLGRQLHDRLATMIEHFEGVGRSLDRAVESYNKTVGSLESRVLVSARKLRELGAAADDLPAVEPVDRRSRSLESGNLFPTLPLPRGDDRL
jgi:DNA recombination protein RmuC